MPRYSRVSKLRLGTCDPNLQQLFNHVIRFWDCKILEGHRSIERQGDMFRRGVSKIDGVTKKGMHNYSPSRAVDVAPYPVLWPDHADTEEERDRRIIRFYSFGNFVLGMGTQMGMIIRWGGDWDRDHVFTDQTFNDLPHFEYIGRLK